MTTNDKHQPTAKMNMTPITRAQRHALNIEHLSNPYRSPHHQQVLTPARTGGKIGRNHRRKHALRPGARMALAIAAMAGIAIAAAALTSLTTHL